MYEKIRWTTLAIVSGVMISGCSSSGGEGAAAETEDSSATTDTSPEDVSSDAPQDGGVVDGAGCLKDLDCAASLPSTTPAGCAEAYCDAVSKKCSFRAKDKDGDGIRAKTCSAAGVTIETGGDCDDADKDVSPGAWDGPKDDSPPAKPDRCDAKDNDCNGKIDDGATAAGLKCSCKPGATRDCAETSTGTPITFPGGAPAGACKKGSQVCGADAQWGSCAGAVAPSARSCSNTGDLDCDGSPDNTVDAVCTCTVGASKSGCYPFASGTPGNGLCKAGTQACVALPAGGAVWDTCKGATGPSGTVDTCDPGNDANCDGAINMGCPCVNGTTARCDAALGAKGSCAAGTSRCVAGAWATCSIGPGTDTCDAGNDASCNGTPNEGCKCHNGDTASCASALGAQGSCASGTSSCVSGNWATCSIGPGIDTCTASNDASCNGTPNEGCFCIDGGTYSCSRPYCDDGTSVRHCTNGKTNTYDACAGGSCPEFDLGESLDLSASNGHVETSLGTCPAGTHVTSCERTYFNGVGWCDATQRANECVLSTGAPWAQWSHCKGKTHCQAD